MPEPELQPLYDRYHSVLKPMIAEYESRNEDFVTPLLIDLPDMFDYIALYEKSRDDAHVKEAMRHLDSAIDAVKTCLVGSMMKNVEQFKSRFPDRVLMAVKEGHFYGKFVSLESKVRECKESNLTQAYDYLKEMENMMQAAHDASLATSLLHDNKSIVAGKWIITILIALIVNWAIMKLI